MQAIFWPTKQKVAERRSRFQQVMELAHKVAEIDPHGLCTLLRLMAAPLQAITITSAAHAKPHGARQADRFGELFFSESIPLSVDGKSAYELAPSHSGQKYRLHLGVDPILATPWRRDRLADAVATIGFGKSQGAWRQDNNHKVSVLLPIGLGIVNGGNHSLAAGIANGEGHVDSTEVHDLAPLYPHVQYDGIAFVRSHDGAVLSQPSDEEPGMLFEIGRLMLRHNVAPYVEPIITTTPEPLLSGGDGYYIVLLNGHDAGVALTPGGAALTLRQAGLNKGDPEWNQVLHSEVPFTRINSRGETEIIQLQWRIRRQVVNDLKHVYGIHSWIKEDAD